MIFLEVAVDAPLFHALTYRSLADSSAPPPGTRVLVPLGRRRLTGYVLASSESPPADLPLKKVKTIIQVLDPSPLLPQSMIPFFCWIAEYYHHPLGEVVRTARVL